MKDFKIVELEQNLEELKKQVEYYKKIAETNRKSLFKRDGRII